MKIYKGHARYEAVTAYEDREVVKAAGGWRWDPTARKWWTADVQAVVRLAAKDGVQIEDAIEQEVKTKAAEIVAALEQSRATNAAIEIPAPAGKEYFPFQKAGVQYMVARDHILLGDEMGLGKTIQSIGLINMTSEIKSVLIVCPASLKLNWSRELSQWLVRPMKVEVVTGKVAPNGADIIIINFDILKKHMEYIKSRNWDLLVVDEAHLVKNPKAQRTKYVAMIKATKKIYMTGTPIVNRPIELLTLLAHLRPQEYAVTFGSDDADRRRMFWRYARRYCDARQDKYGWDFSGAAHLEELQDKLRASVLLRRMKADVLRELPPKVRQVVAVEDLDIVRREKTSMGAIIGAMSGEYGDVIERMKSDTAMFSELSRIRHETALAKVPYVVQFLMDTTEDEKVVVFAHHRDVIKQIAGAFGDAAVVLMGGDNIEDRQRAIDRFQSDTSVKFFVGSIFAAGVGITLTSASRVVFAEVDWVPGNMSQAEDRCHRIGQQSSVLVQHIVVNDSLDVHIVNTIIKKQGVIERAMDKETGTADELKKVETVKVCVEKAEEVDSDAYRKVRRNRGLVEVGMTEEQVVAVLDGIRQIAERCDGAHAEDGSGFSKMDTHFGKSLAALDILTPRQAAAGFKIVRKYQRQVSAEVLRTLGIL